MAFYSWSHRVGFPLCGTSLEACQTFPCTAQSVHTLGVQLNTQFLRLLPPPCASPTLTLSTCKRRKSTHAHLFVPESCIAAGTYRFHATGLITNVYEREPVSVTGSNHNKRAQVSQELVRGVTNLLKVCHIPKKNASGLKSKPLGTPYTSIKSRAYALSNTTESFRRLRWFQIK